MERADEVGAAAAATYFMELFAYVYASGDLIEWDQIGADECKLCSNVHDDVAAVYDAGGRYTGGSITLEPSETVAQDEMLGVFAVVVPFESAPLEQLDGGGAVIEAHDVETGFARLEVIYTANGWTLLGGRPSDREGL